MNYFIEYTKIISFTNPLRFLVFILLMDSHELRIGDTRNEAIVRLAEKVSQVFLCIWKNMKMSAALLNLTGATMHL